MAFGWWHGCAFRQITISDRPGARFRPGRNFLGGAGVLILAVAGAGDFWSRFGAQSD